MIYQIYLIFQMSISEGQKITFYLKKPVFERSEVNTKCPPHLWF